MFSLFRLKLQKPKKAESLYICPLQKNMTTKEKVSLLKKKSYYKKVIKITSFFVKPIISPEKHKINMLPKGVCHERRSRGEFFNKTRNCFIKGEK